MNTNLADKRAWAKKRNAEAKVIRDARRALAIPYKQDKVYPAFMLGGCLFIASLMLIGGCLVAKPAHAADIDMNKIAMIESSGCKQKIGKFEHARGCWQVTSPALADWNQAHPREQYRLEQMLNDRLCLKVASWYMNVRIPQMIRAYGKPVSTKSILVAYNAGIKYVRFDLPLPTKTISYLNKYGA